MQLDVNTEGGDGGGESVPIFLQDNAAMHPDVNTNAICIYMYTL